MTTRPCRGRRVKTLAALALPALVAALAGCSTEGSSAAAGAGAGGGTSSSRGGDVQAAGFDWDVAFASCMRGQGIDFPDPKPGEQVGQTKVDDTDAYKTADAICTKTVEKARGKRPESDEQRKRFDAWNKTYEKTIDCLRKKGYTVEALDGGFTTEDQIPDGDWSACRPEGSEDIAPS